MAQPVLRTFILSLRFYACTASRQPIPRTRSFPVFLLPSAATSQTQTDPSHCVILRLEALTRRVKDSTQLIIKEVERRGRNEIAQKVINYKGNKDWGRFAFWFIFCWRIYLFQHHRRRTAPRQRRAPDGRASSRGGGPDTHCAPPSIITRRGVKPNSACSPAKVWSSRLPFTHRSWWRRSQTSFVPLWSLGFF